MRRMTGIGLMGLSFLLGCPNDGTKLDTAPTTDSENTSPDRDGDGLLNEDDACPDNAEDMDGNSDNDGCPEDEDTDHDGVIDSADDCPDLSGTPANHGCPDDTDGDGVYDTDDLCPGLAEDLDGNQDEDGCPEDEDSDGDGILDADDQCPNEAENINGIEDTDGCPENGASDRDGDGIEDAFDDCPAQPETVNGCTDTDGCPDTCGGGTGDAALAYAGSVSGNGRVLSSGEFGFEFYPYDYQNNTWDVNTSLCYATTPLIANGSANCSGCDFAYMTIGTSGGSATGAECASLAAVTTTATPDVFVNYEFGLGYTANYAGYGLAGMYVYLPNYASNGWFVFSIDYAPNYSVSGNGTTDFDWMRINIDPNTGYPIYYSY